MALLEVPTRSCAQASYEGICQYPQSRRNRQSRGQRSGSDPYFVMVTGPLSGGQEDSLAEQAEGGAAIRLAFDHLESVDVALDHSRAPGHGEAVQDGVVIALDSAGE